MISNLASPDTNLSLFPRTECLAGFGFVTTIGYKNKFFSYKWRILKFFQGLEVNSVFNPAKLTSQLYKDNYAIDILSKGYLAFQPTKCLFTGF